MTSNYLPYLPVIVAALVFAVIGAICFVGSQRAFEHSRKNLSWIRRHGAGGYPFARNAFPDKPADWLGVFGVAVFALVVSMIYYALRAHYYGTGWLSGLFSVGTLVAVAFCVAGAVALYYLLQRLFGSTLVSAGGSLLFAASVVGSHAAAAMLAVALLLLVLWLTAKREKPFPAELLYYGAQLLLCLTLALRPQLLPFVLLFAGLHLYRHIYQLRRDEETPGMLALAIVLAALVWLLGVLLFTIARSTLYYGMSFAMVAEHLLPDFFGYMGRLLAGGLRLTVRPLLRSRVLQPMMDAPLLGLGGFGVISAIVLYLRRKDPRSVLVLLIAFTAVLVWTLSDCSVLSLALALSAGLLFSNYERGGKRWPVVCVCVLGVLYYLALLALSFILPLSTAILERIA